jgi:hypothetical protein
VDLALHTGILVGEAEHHHLTSWSTKPLLISSMILVGEASITT